MLHFFLGSFWRRLLSATALWIAFWPIFWYFRHGQITDHAAFFWIIGELNYPAALIVFVLADKLFEQFSAPPWAIFLASSVVAALSVPLYYHKVGFTLGVFLESYLY